MIGRVAVLIVLAYSLVDFYKIFFCTHERNISTYNLQAIFSLFRLFFQASRYKIFL